MTPMTPMLLARRRLRRSAFAAWLGIAVAAPLACNVFTSIAHCESDGDCPQGSTCDPRGRYCLRVEPAEASTEDAPVEAAPGDATADVVPRPCDTSRPFGAATLVPGLEDVALLSARFTPSERSVLVAKVNGPASGIDVDLFAASRVDDTAPFVLGGPVPGVNEPQSAEFWPTLTADGRLLFFESSRSLQKVDGSFENDQARIWSASRVTTVADFEPPKIQSAFALEAGSPPETSPYLHPGGRSLYFGSYARGGAGAADVFVAKLDELGLVTSVENLAVVNTAVGEIAPVVTLDETALYFARDESNLTAVRDVWVARRASASASFGPPTKVAELSTSFDEIPTWVSDDHCRLYFISDRPNGRSDAAPGTGEAYRLWVARR